MWFTFKTQGTYNRRKLALRTLHSFQCKGLFGETTLLNWLLQSRLHVIRLIVRAAAIVHGILAALTSL